MQIPIEGSTHYILELQNKFRKQILEAKKLAFLNCNIDQSPNIIVGRLGILFLENTLKIRPVNYHKLTLSF